MTDLDQRTAPLRAPGQHSAAWLSGALILGLTVGLGGGWALHALRTEQAADAADRA